MDNNPERQARDYTGKVCPMPKPAQHGTRWVATYAGGYVELWATGASFAVVYGLQMKKGLSYAATAKELGECLLHVLQCEGRLG
jgi:hypothetical protein